MRPLVRQGSGRTGERSKRVFWLCARNARRAGENSHCAGSAARRVPGEKGSRGVFGFRKGERADTAYAFTHARACWNSAAISASEGFCRD
jgi:hypothetical protein